MLWPVPVLGLVVLPAAGVCFLGEPSSRPAISTDPPRALPAAPSRHADRMPSCLTRPPVLCYSVTGFAYIQLAQVDAPPIARKPFFRLGLRASLLNPPAARTTTGHIYDR